MVWDALCVCHKVNCLYIVLRLVLSCNIRSFNSDNHHLFSEYNLYDQIKVESGLARLVEFAFFPHSLCIFL